MYGCSGSFNRYNLLTFEAEGCRFDPRPRHLSKILLAMILEPRALQLKAVELFLFSLLIAPVNALLSVEGSNRADISGSAF